MYHFEVNYQAPAARHTSAVIGSADTLPQAEEARDSHIAYYVGLGYTILDTPIWQYCAVCAGVGFRPCAHRHHASFRPARCEKPCKPCQGTGFVA